MDSAVDAAAAVVVVEISQQDLQIRFLVSIVSHEKCSNVAEMGTFMHACEGDMLYESTNTKIPYFNAPIYLENKVTLAPFSTH